MTATRFGFGDICKAVPTGPIRRVSEYGTRGLTRFEMEKLKNALILPRPKPSVEIPPQRRKL